MLFHDEQRSYRQSLLGLVGHMLGTTLIFLTLFVLAWIVGVALDALHTVHPFPPDVLEVVRNVSLWIVYVDIALCIVVLGSGFVRFAKDVIGGKHESSL